MAAQSVPSQRTPPARARLAALGVLIATLALLGGYCARRLDVTTDITHFLPDGRDAWGARVVESFSRSALGQRMVLTIGGADPDTLLAAGGRLARLLAAHPDVVRVQRGVDAGAQRDLYQLYFARRHHLFSTTPEHDYAEWLSDAGLQRAAARLIAGLSSVESPFLRQIAPEDPLLAFPRLLARLEAAREGGLALRDGAFFSADARHAVLLVETRVSALDGTAQRRVQDAVTAAFADVRRVHGDRLTLEQSGVGRYSVHAEESIRADVQRVGLISSGALLALFFVLFRSLRALLLVSLPVLLGMLVGCAAVLAVHGRVHGATLAFGATLIGVCVDYPVHLIVHHELAPAGRSATSTLRAIWPALLLASLTTLAGLAGFGWASFPGIREIALFTGAGVLGALLTTRFALPHLLGPGGHAGAAQRGLAAALDRGARALHDRPALAGALLVAAALLCALGLPGLRFEDDLSSWVPAPRALRAEDERVRARVLAADAGRVVLTRAADAERALRANDRVALALDEATRAGEIGGYRSLHALIWSEQLQRRNLQALAAAPALPERLDRAFAEAGFTDQAFAPFFASLQRPAAALSLPALLASPLAPAARAFVLDAGDAPALVTYLRDVRDGARLERRLAAIPEARYFDQRGFLRATYGAFRARALELIALGVAVVFLMVLARYRRLRPALAAVLPAVLAAGGALAVLGLLGVTIDLFHALGLLLVLSMGEDYGVFLVESRNGEGLPATLLALVLACASTVLSFGLLAMSSIPALRSLGQVIGVGILLALLWAPAGLVLLGRGGSR
jgi:predicted exporter